MVLALVLALATGAVAAFLQDTLPLKALSITPDSTTNAPYQLSGSDTLTVVFNRPVIALGNDWAMNSTDITPSNTLVPFNLVSNGVSIKVPGQFRWVTTYIARFDADVDWPTDLTFSLVINPKLTTYDGATLSGSQPNVTYQTGPMTACIQQVLSAKATALTDSWTANWGDGGLPEVPSDGRILVQFSYPVVRATVAAALKVRRSDTKAAVTFTTAACPAVDYFPGPIFFATSSASTSTSQECVLVVPQGLTSNVQYDIVLPKGSTYNPVAGPASADIVVSFSSLRPFTFPMNSGSQYGGFQPQFTGNQFDLWLVHGLKAGTTMAQVKAQMTLVRSSPPVAQYGTNPMNPVYSARPMSAPGYPGIAGSGTMSFPPMAPMVGSATTTSRAPMSTTTTFPMAMGTTLNAPTTLNGNGHTRRLLGVAMSAVQPRQMITSYQYQGPAMNAMIGAPTMLNSGYSVAGSVGYGATPTVTPTVNPTVPVVGTPVAFDVVRADNGTLRVRGTFAPQGYYQLQFKAGGVYDGFGQPLQAQVISWTMQNPQPFFGQVDGDVVIEKAALTVNQWTVLTRGDPTSQNTQILSLYAVQPAQIASALGFSNGATTARFATVPFSQANSDSTATFRVANLPMPTTSIFLRQLTTAYSGGGSPYTQSSLTSVTNLAASAIWNGSTVLVWVTQLSDGTNVAGATVSLYSSPPPTGSYPQVNSPYTLAAQGTTKSDGTVILTASTAASSSSSSNSAAGSYSYGGSNTYRIIVTSGQDSTFVNVQSYGIFSLGGSSATTTSGVIITDRALYKKGDTVYVKAYARKGQNGAWQVPTAGSTLTVSWAPSQTNVYPTYMGGYPMSGQTGASGSTTQGQSSSSDTQVSMPVSWDPVFGTWSGQLVVPQDAMYGPVTLSITDAKSSSSQQSSSPAYPSYMSSIPPTPYGSGTFISTTITVADPRPPTVTLGFASNTTYYKINAANNGDYFATATVLTGTGEPVSGAGVLINWNYFSNTNSDSGSFTVTSNQNGLAVAKITLKKLLKNATIIQPGSTLSLQASWVGPTGESLLQFLSATVDRTDWMLNLNVIPYQPIPGLGFATEVTLSSHDGTAITGQTVNIKLENANNAVVGTCSAQSSTAGAQCTGLTLPAVGLYKLVATVTDPTGFVVTQTIPLGKTLSDWQDSPLEQYPEMDFTLDKTVYNSGDVPKLRFWNPYPTASLLIYYGNAQTKQTQVMAASSLVQGVNTISITGATPTACALGCSLAAVLSVPRQSATALKLPVNLPVSKLFDIRAPHFHSNSYLSITFANPPKLAVTATLSTTSAAPEANVTIQLSAKRGATAVKAEFAVFVVDQAYLDLQPYPLVPLNTTFQQTTLSNYQLSDSRSSLLNFAGYRAFIASYTGRCTNDSWVTPNWYELQPGSFSYGKQDVDMSDQEFYDQFSNRATSFGSQLGCGFGGGSFPLYSLATAQMARGPVPTAPGVEMAYSSAARVTGAVSNGAMTIDTSASLSTGSGSAFTSDLQLRSNFEVTPLFIGNVIVDPAVPGSNSVKLSLPDNIATFSVRVYAVDTANNFASAETKIVSQKPLSLQAMLPRITRLGDTFDSGVTVAASDPTFSGTVQVSVSIPGTSSGLLLTTSTGNTATTATQQVQVRGTTPVQVSFPFQAVSLGSFTVNFAASVSGRPKYVDGLSETLDVLPVQNSVVVSTSMAISAASAGQPWTEGLSFPAALPGSGNLSIVAGVGRYPAVLAQLGLLTPPANPQPYQRSSDAEIARVLGRAVLTLYPNQNANAVNLGSQADSLTLLQSFTDSNLGLRYSDIYPVQPFDQPDIQLNAFALYANQRAGSTIPSSLTSVWSAALEAGLTAAVQNSLTNQNTWNDWDTLALVYLALGPQWSPATTMDVQNVLSLSNLVSKRSGLSLVGKFRLALLTQLYPNSNVPSASQIVTDAVNTAIGARVQGQTAYIPASAGSASAADAEVHALALEVLVKSKNTNPIVEDIANYVARSGSWYFSPTDTVQTALALADYDVSKGSAQPSITFSVLAASTNAAISTTNFNSPTAPLLNLNEPWSQLPKLKDGTPTPLSFQAQGSGEVSVAVSLDFVPATLPQSPIYRGLYIEKIIRAIDPTTGTGTGNPIQVAQAGTYVEVTLQVMSPDDLDSVLLEDWVPGGLEPVDPNVNGNGVPGFSVGGFATSQSPYAMNAIRGVFVQGGPGGGMVGSYGDSGITVTNGRKLQETSYTLPRFTGTMTTMQTGTLTAGAPMIMQSPLTTVAGTRVIGTPMITTTFAAPVGQQQGSTGAAPTFLNAGVAASGPINYGTASSGAVSVAPARPAMPMPSGTSQMGNGMMTPPSGPMMPPPSGQMSSPMMPPGGMMPDSGYGGYSGYDSMYVTPSYRSNFIPWSPLQSPFSSPQVATDRVTYFASSLAAGVYSVTYKALAVTEGKWSLPPAKASVTSQPGVMGLSVGGTLLVSSSASTPAQVSALLRANGMSTTTTSFIPKSCSATCDDASQYCNVQTGACQAISASLIQPLTTLKAAAAAATAKPATTARATARATAKPATTIKPTTKVTATTAAPAGCALTNIVATKTGTTLKVTWSIKSTCNVNVAWQPVSADPTTGIWTSPATAKNLKQASSPFTIQVASVNANSKFRVKVTPVQASGVLGTAQTVTSA